MARPTRRQTLQVLTSTIAASIAGCSTDSDPRTTSSTETESTTGTIGTTTGTTGTPPADTVVSLDWVFADLSGTVGRVVLPNRPRTPDTTGGPLYVSTDAGEVARIGVLDGTVEWIHEVRGAAAGQPYPLITSDDATIFVVSETRTTETLRNYVEALDPGTGERRWTFATREFLTPLGVVDDVLYIAGHYIEGPPTELGPEQSPRGNGSLHGVGTESGMERWTIEVPRLVGGSVAPHGLYVLEEPRTDGPEASAGRTLKSFALDASLRWTAETGTYGLSSPFVTDDKLLAGADGAIGRYDTETGDLHWTVGEWERGPSTITMDQTPDFFYAGSKPVVSFTRDGAVRFSDADGSRIVEPIRRGVLYLWDGVAIEAVDSDDGKRKWIYRPDDEKYTYPRAVVETGILVNDGIAPVGRFALHGVESGDRLGTFETPAPHESVTGLRERVFVGTEDGVYAYQVDP